MESLIQVGSHLELKCAVYQEKHRAGLQASETFVSRVLSMQPPRAGKPYYRFAITTPSNEQQTSRDDIVYKYLVSIDSIPYVSPEVKKQKQKRGFGADKHPQNIERQQQLLFQQQQQGGFFSGYGTGQDFNIDNGDGSDSETTPNPDYQPQHLQQLLQLPAPLQQPLNNPFTVQQPLSLTSPSTHSSASPLQQTPSQQLQQQHQSQQSQQSQQQQLQLQPSLFAQPQNHSQLGLTQQSTQMNLVTPSNALSSHSQILSGSGQNTSQAQQNLLGRTNLNFTGLSSNTGSTALNSLQPPSPSQPHHFYPTSTLTQSLVHGHSHQSPFQPQNPASTMSTGTSGIFNPSSAFDTASHNSANRQLGKIATIAPLSLQPNSNSVYHQHSITPTNSTANQTLFNSNPASFNAPQLNIPNPISPRNAIFTKPQTSAIMSTSSSSFSNTPYENTASATVFGTAPNSLTLLPNPSDKTLKVDIFHNPVLQHPASPTNLQSPMNPISNRPFGTTNQQTQSTHPFSNNITMPKTSFQPQQHSGFNTNTLNSSQPNSFSQPQSLPLYPLTSTAPLVHTVPTQTLGQPNHYQPFIGISTGSMGSLTLQPHLGNPNTTTGSQSSNTSNTITMTVPPIHSLHNNNNNQINKPTSILHPSQNQNQQSSTAVNQPLSPLFSLFPPQQSQPISFIRQSAVPSQTHMNHQGQSQGQMGEMEKAPNGLAQLTLGTTTSGSNNGMVDTTPSASNKTHFNFQQNNGYPGQTPTHTNTFGNVLNNPSVNHLMTITTPLAFSASTQMNNTPKKSSSYTFG